MNKQSLLDENDTKIFIKKSNVSYYRFLFYALKHITSPKDFKRYIAKAKSIKKNKKINNYPNGFQNSGKRVAVYTALFGDYDQIKKIKAKNRLCDYFIFTDQYLPPDCDWQLKQYEFNDKTCNTPVLKNRFLKMHPHLLFPEYDYSIYVDATIVIELDIMRLMSRIGENCLALFEHHAGVNDSFVEAERVKRIGLAPKDIVDKQMEKYKREGFPANFGFFECGIIVRKHNDKDCISIMNTWWEEFVNESKRDQLSFMYSVWKNNKNHSDISSLGLTYWIDPIVLGMGHNKLRKKDD